MPCIGRVPVRATPRSRSAKSGDSGSGAPWCVDHAERIDADEQQFRHQHGGRIKAHAFAIEPVRIAARPAIGSSGCTSVAACAWRANEGAFMAWSVTRRRAHDDEQHREQHDRPDLGSFVNRLNISKTGSSHASTRMLVAGQPASRPCAIRQKIAMPSHVSS